MKLLYIILSVVLTLSTTEALLSCNSRLRIIRPWLFSHCRCSYTEWTDWQQVPNSVGDDKSLGGTCESGKAYQESRRQYSIGQSSNCPDRVENRSVCMPTRAERLALFLGLGQRSSGAIRPIVTAVIYPDEDSDSGQLLTKRQAPSECQEKPICREYSQTRGKRLSHLMEESPHPGNAIKHNDPIPFSIEEHGHRLKRDVNKCDPGDKKHVLFVLDTSGSIGQANFKKMINSTADLVPLFCDNITVAMLTFNHEIHLEFDFDCFPSTDLGRFEVYNAIKAIKYRGGATHTGGAAKCICNKLISSTYGVEMNSDATCVEVIFITDGQSNDPNYKICEEVKCLHDHNLKLNTYSLGIGRYKNAAYQAELDCIQDSVNQMSLFSFKSFDEFSQIVQEIIGNDLFGRQCWETNVPPPKSGKK